MSALRRGCSLQGSASDEAAGLVAEATATLASLESALAAWKLTALLGGPYDAGGAVLSIQVYISLHQYNGDGISKVQV